MPAKSPQALARKAARKAERRKERMQDPEQKAKRRAYERNRKYKKTYGITIARRDELIRQQDGRCAICLLKKRLVTDHDHRSKTPHVRGMLCDMCNRGLGFFRDSAPNLEAAAEYLREFSKNHDYTNQ